ncbi:MAG: hypothetical protein FWD22_04945 [Treponema sp.]|nr:hypothetical protein [Treponema sp.]
MNPLDRAIISGIAKDSIIASRIFVTGEVNESYIGEQAYRLLINVNDTMYTNGVSLDPLFVETKRDTVKMTRFDPEFIWRSFHPDIFISLVSDEAKRLGINIDPDSLEYFDFYESVISALKKEKGDYIIPVIPKGSNEEQFYSAVYLSCLLLFNKPGFMDVSAQEHFTDIIGVEQFKWAKYKELNNVQKKEVEKLRENFGNIQGLTNSEMHFIVKLFE